MSDARNVLSNNSVYGDMAGRDIVKVVNVSSNSYLHELAEKFSRESESDKHLSDFIEQLQRFMEAETNPTGIDLPTKLESSGREDAVLTAMRLKESFSKKLMHHQFSENAQFLFAHILAKIHAFFCFKVHPKVTAGATRVEVDALIFDELLSPLYDEVGASGIINLSDVQGMMYYLAGNCHIDWK